ncbi:MAG TPA: YihY/virulence factor BrkB family protein [Candidatus Saccharimonadales bacterium]|nr:YihY/virulence factor BrkB family protein [Candidatus Saccharimonadales bacterium]
MRFLSALVRQFDAWQRRHRLAAFVHAVIKKYGEDNAGYQAALLTYYGFVALFPLLLILSTLTALVSTSHVHLQHVVIDSTTRAFPVLGQQLESHVQGLHKSGLALITGLLFTFYGARGVAGAFRTSVNHIWRVPRHNRPGFPKSLGKNLMIIIVGGLGFVLAGLCTYLTATAGHEFIFQVLSVVVDLLTLFWLFQVLLNISLPERVALKQTRSAALSAAIGLVVLQTLGGYLLKRELKDLDALYSYFALALGLLFWLYLQAQVICYALEIAAVHTHELWPRSLYGKPSTPADHRAQQEQLKEPT